MKQLKFNPDEDMKELEKYGYLEGKDTTNVSYKCYGKVFELEFNERLKDYLIDVVEIDKETGKVELSRSSKNSFRSFVNDDWKLLIYYTDDLIKANLLIVEEDNE